MLGQRVTLSGEQHEIVLSQPRQAAWPAATPVVGGCHGIASPTSSLEHESGKASYGVAPPVAVIVDLDSVHAAPDRLVRAGIGDAVSNLSAIADWELAVAHAGERIDGLAVTLARTAAQAVLHQPGTIASDEFLTVR